MSWTFTVEPRDADRADRWLRRQYPGASRREIASLFSEGAVRVDGKRAVKGTRVPAGCTIELEREPRTDLQVVASEDDAEVLVETEDLVAVAKPAGIPTHPLAAGELGALANRVAHRYPECRDASDDPREGGAVHRLDRGTSGVVIFARTPAAYSRLRAAFGKGEVEKVYWALTRGVPGQAVIDAPLAQRGDHAMVSATGLPARTEVRPIAARNGWHLIECRTSSGRRHQIRAHMAHAGAAIVGDALYGGLPSPAPLVEFFLHARRIEVPAAAGERLVIEAPLPKDRAQLLAELGLVEPQVGSKVAKPTLTNK